MEAIYFNKENTYGKGHPVSTDYFIKPDMVICENGVGRPRRELLSYVGYQDKGSEEKVSLGNEHIPHANTRFALIHNDIHSPILAVGSAVEFPSFIPPKRRIRGDHQAYNMEAAFFAAMSMLDKRVEFRYIPHSYLQINDVPFHFVGETNHKHSEIILDGDVDSGRFIMWYVYGEEIIGFCTVGYKNLHLYLWEAMKLLIMPPAMPLRTKMIDHRAIVAKVLKCRSEITAKRKATVQLPSIIRAEFTREREKLGDFRSKLKQNMASENDKQR